MAGTSSNPRVSENNKDPCWKYVELLDPNTKNKNDLRCIFCNKVNKGGITRAKQHIVGGFRNSKICTKCPPHVHSEIQEYMVKKAASTLEKVAIPDFVDIDTFGDDEDEDDIGLQPSSQQQPSKQPPKRPRQKGLLDLYFTPSAEKVVKGRKDAKMKQATINDACKKELREKACMDIARWMYDAAIPFNAVNYPSFPVMVQAIGQYGIGMKAPSFHEVRVPFLRKVVDEVKDSMKPYEAEWSKYGCSIMTDGWTDKRSRTLINFLVNSPSGTVFLESIDASEQSKAGEMMLSLFDNVVERVGVKNVVQIVTDSASNNVKAGKALMRKRPNLYWTPCAAHCIDLILEDIGKLEKARKTLKMGVSFSSYIYVRSGVVNMLRRFTNGRDLIRPGVTRFATAFLTLQSIHNQKKNLRMMFTSEEWTSSKWAKEAAGKRATSTVLNGSFWTSIVHILKVFGPLVRVLRLVDGEKRPAMGYIYEAMDRAKETIEASFTKKGKEKDDKKYKEVFEIIDRRWECQLHQPLHAAGHYLNPEFFYANSSKILKDKEVCGGLFECLMRLVPDLDVQDKIMSELSLYHNSQELFGTPLAIRHRNTKSPAEWWTCYGSSAPNLAEFAVKVLSLTCSASGCERNWSMFEHVHNKKRNKLSQKKLNDLVFVKYNRALKRRHDARDRIDPISLRDIDESNEWLMGKLDDDEGSNEDEDDLVFENDTLTWGLVGKAAGVEESAHNTRRVGKKAKVSSSKDRGKAHVVVRDEEEEETEFVDEDEENEFDDQEFDDALDEECDSDDEE